MDQTTKIQQDLISELGLDNLSEDKQRELIIKMTEALLKRIFLDTMEKLKDEDKETYGQMVEHGPDPEEVEKFLREKIPDYERFVQTTIENFKEEMKKA